MQPYFNRPKRLQDLSDILHEWEGTPYAHWTGVKQGGCDCIHFITRVLEELGFPEWQIPWYPKDWHLHNSDELLLNGMRAEPVMLEVDVNRPKDGDIVLFRFGKTSSHAGFYLCEHVYQAITGIGVERRHWQDRQWHKRRTHAFRVMEVI